MMNTHLFYYLVEQSNPIFRELYSTVQVECTLNKWKKIHWSLAWGSMLQSSGYHFTEWYTCKECDTYNIKVI